MIWLISRIRFCGKTKMKAAGRHGIILNFYINPSVFTGDLRFLPEIYIYYLWEIFEKGKPLKTEENIFPRERLIIRHDKLTSETRGLYLQFIT